MKLRVLVVTITIFRVDLYISYTQFKGVLRGVAVIL